MGKHLGLDTKTSTLLVVNLFNYNLHFPPSVTKKMKVW